MADRRQRPVHATLVRGQPERGLGESRSLGRRVAAKWFPFNNGGGFRRWYGNLDISSTGQDGGAAFKRLIEEKSAYPMPTTPKERWYFLPSVSLGQDWHRILLSATTRRGSVRLAGNNLYCRRGRVTAVGIAAHLALGAMAPRIFMRARHPTLNVQIRNLPSDASLDVEVLKHASRGTERLRGDGRSRDLVGLGRDGLELSGSSTLHGQRDRRRGLTGAQRLESGETTRSSPKPTALRRGPLDVPLTGCPGADVEFSTGRRTSHEVRLRSSSSECDVGTLSHTPSAACSVGTASTSQA